MSIVRNKLSIAIIRRLLPDRYFDDIYYNKLLDKKNFRLLTLKQMAWCSAHGFLPCEYKWYDLDKNDYRNYLPALNNFKNRKINGAYNAILGNKLIFEKHIKNVIEGIPKLHVIESIAFTDQGNLKPLNKEIICNDFNSLIPFLERNDLILKPISGDGGEGLMKISKEDDHILINKKMVNWNELIYILKQLDHYLIQERFIQHGFSHDIYPDSLNTLRIGTMIDPDTGKSFIAYATHRFGSPRSGFIDNIKQGGLFSMIDISNGRLGKAVYISHITEDKTFSDQHPSTLKQIRNEFIPNWSELVVRILEMAERMPYLKYVGWDIALSNDNLYVLEGNVSPGITFQLFKPLKEFPSAWKFFKHYKYI